MSESLREAVEGFERDRRIYTPEETRAIWEKAAKVLREHEVRENEIARIVRRFRRQDVHDCLTAANDERQAAIASPKLAEQANALATRLNDLAERIADLLEEAE